MSSSRSLSKPSSTASLVLLTRLPWVPPEIFSPFELCLKADELKADEPAAYECWSFEDCLGYWLLELMLFWCDECVAVGRLFGIVPPEPLEIDAWWELSTPELFEFVLLVRLPLLIYIANGTSLLWADYYWLVEEFELPLDFCLASEGSALRAGLVK